MSETIRQIEIGDTTVSVRRQRPADSGFLVSLFRANAVRVLELSGLPRAVLEDLVAMQYHSRMQTYQALFPTAVWSIVERHGEPIGEIIEHDEGDCVYVVDIALLPAQQARGIGTALMRVVMATCARKGQSVRAKVMINNDASLKMFATLGFVASEPDEVSHVELRWECPDAART